MCISVTRFAILLEWLNAGLDVHQSQLRSSLSNWRPEFHIRRIGNLFESLRVKKCGIWFRRRILHAPDRLIWWSDLTFDWSDLTFGFSDLTGSDPTMVRSNCAHRLVISLVYIDSSPWTLEWTCIPKKESIQKGNATLANGVCEFDTITVCY